MNGDALGDIVVGNRVVDVEITNNDEVGVKLGVSVVGATAAVCEVTTDDDDVELGILTGTEADVVSLVEVKEGDVVTLVALDALRDKGVLV